MKKKSNNYKPLNVLHLSLKHEPFEVMITGEKTNEYRQPSDWIKKRLFNKDGSPKHYDTIKFTNGYGPLRPMFICEFKGFMEICWTGKYEFSNGLIVNVTPGVFDIKLGKIGETTIK